MASRHTDLILARCARVLFVALAVPLLVGSTCEDKSPADPEENGVINGTVRVDGSPRPGVAVMLAPRSSGGTRLTDGGGRYEFLVVSPGTYTVSIAEPSGTTCNPKERPAEVQVLFTTVVDFFCTTLRGNIEGTVTVDGMPQPDVTVELKNQAGLVVQTDVTGSGGDYGFLVDPGTYTVTIGAPFGTTCTPMQETVTVQALDTIAVDFSCTSQPTTGTLRVVVTTNGSLQPGAMVTILHTGGSRTSTTGPNGVATFENLDQGMYTVATTLAGYFCGSVSDTVTAGQETIVNVTCVASP